MDHQLRFAFCLLCLLAPLASAQTTFDPLTIGVGARSLGMGRALVAAASGGDAIFNNPAGLGETDRFEFTSMAANLLDDANYTVLGGVYPLGNQLAAGVGYAGSFVTGMEIRNAAGTLQSKANWGESVIMSSVGKKLAGNLSLGLNFKYYFIDGTEVDSGDGWGWNLDAGILQRDLGWLSLGLLAQNVLSGNQIRYQKGTEEKLPFSLKGGASFYILGAGFAAAHPSNLELTANLDASIDLQRSKPLGLHTGLEFSPNPAISLRAGSDQNDLTYGLSLKFAGLGLHYAYHPPAHYLSISFDERGWSADHESPSRFAARRCNKTSLVLK